MKRLIVWTLFMFGVLHLFGGEKNVSIINGKFENKLYEGMEITLYYCPGYYAVSEPALRGQSFTTKVKNGKFAFHLANTPDEFYIQLTYGDIRMVEQLPWHTINLGIFLLEKNSDIELGLADNHCEIHGRKADLFACQYNMRSLVFVKKHPKYNKDSYYLRLKEQKEYGDSVLKAQLNVLDSFRGKVSDRAYKILQYDYKADNEIKLLKALSVQSNSKWTQRNKETIKFYTDYFLYGVYDTDFSDEKFFSRSHAYFLYLKYLTDLGIVMKAVDGQLRPTFGQIYTYITDKFDDNKVLGRLLATLFIDYHRRGGATTWHYDDALQRIKGEEDAEIILLLKQHLTKGKPATFTLLDTAGKEVTEKRFKGKVVVLDFWFTGCTACIHLNKEMDKVYHYYEHNEDVVFINVCVDKNRVQWLKSVKSGLYTHKNSIPLYTEGRGKDHQLIKSLDVFAFPTLVILDQRGNILSSNPPMPQTGESQKKLFDLIDLAIENGDEQ
ncbi:hypothetical protein GCM10023231_00590 [Olivibacter ginsenosidimutans]|uniref:Thioredoxin domain-containing protein n=1 Tax=Olivibacter ginsenosidimutans TaxID=1176537 RepID=A0ABP9ABT4_9SPHI